MQNSIKTTYTVILWAGDYKIYTKDKKKKKDKHVTLVKFYARDMLNMIDYIWNLSE